MTDFVALKDFQKEIKVAPIHFCYISAVSTAARIGDIWSTLSMSTASSMQIKSVSVNSPENYDTFFPFKRPICRLNPKNIWDFSHDKN